MCYMTWINNQNVILSLYQTGTGWGFVTDGSLHGGIRLIFLYVVVLFVHRKSVAEGGTMGELKALYKIKIPYKVNLWR